jgi:natural product precursor
MKKITKKLSLNKANLTELDKNQVNQVKGGATTRDTCGCTGGGHQTRACTVTY